MRIAVYSVYTPTILNQTRQHKQYSIAAVTQHTEVCIFKAFLSFPLHRIPFSLIRYSLFIYSIKFTGISVNALSFVGYLLLYSMIPVYCCNSSQIFSRIKCNFCFTQRIIHMTNAILALKRSQRYIANQVTHKILSYSCIYRMYRMYIE